MKRKIPLKTIFQANTDGYSSKRVFGAIGFLVSIGIAITCTVLSTEAPTIVVDIIYASVMLLGVDSVTGIWKTRVKQIHKNESPIVEDAIEEETDYDDTRN